MIFFNLLIYLFFYFVFFFVLGHSECWLAVEKLRLSNYSFFSVDFFLSILTTFQVQIMFLWQHKFWIWLLLVKVLQNDIFSLL